MISISVGSLTSTSTFNYSAAAVIVAALVALGGVIYSKNIERQQNRINKIEEFSKNLFKWLTLIDELFIHSYDLKERNVNRKIDILALEYVDIRQKMASVLDYSGRYLLLSSLYKKEIKNNDLINEIENLQIQAVRSILSMLQSTNIKDIREKKESINENLISMRSLAKSLMKNIKL